MQPENSPLRHPLPCSHCLVNDGKDPDDDSYRTEFVQHVFTASKACISKYRSTEAY
jgi:hypothetical protein